MLTLPVKYRLSEGTLSGKELIFIRKYNTCATVAVNHPGSLIKLCAGYYLSYIDGELVEFDHIDEGENRSEWIAREATGHWYSDPFETLRGLHIAVKGDWTPEE